MPYININDSVEIEVDDFLDCCSSTELKEIVKILKQNGHLPDYIEKSNEEMSLIDEEWSILSNKMFKCRLQIDNDDFEAIKNILKKY